MIKSIIFDLGNTLVSETSVVAFPYAIEVLKELSTKYKLGLITNCMPETSRDDILRILREADIPDCFGEIIISSELGYSKPDPRIFNLMLEKLGVTSEEAVMVGNLVSTDIFGGNRVGMKTVLFQPSPEYQRSNWEHPDYTINSLEKLLDVLNSI